MDNLKDVAYRAAFELFLRYIDIDLDASAEDWWQNFSQELEQRNDKYEDEFHLYFWSKSDTHPWWFKWAEADGCWYAGVVWPDSTNKVFSDLSKTDITATNILGAVQSLAENIEQFVQLDYQPIWE